MRGPGKTFRQIIWLFASSWRCYKSVYWPDSAGFSVMHHHFLPAAPPLFNGFIGKIFLKKIPVFPVNIIIEPDPAAFSFTGKIPDIDWKTRKTTYQVLFLSLNPGLQGIGAVLDCIPANQEIGQFLPFLHPHTPVT